MAKGQAKRSKKYLREAGQVRQMRTRAFIRLILAVAAAVILWALYTFLPTDRSMLTSGLVFAAALIIVVIIGELGVKYSRYNTEYNKLKNIHGLDDASIKAQMKQDAQNR